MNEDFNESDELISFFTALKKYNGDADLKPELSDKIESYFAYKWEHDKNIALAISEVQYMLTKLPIEVNRRIIIEFLFKDFIKCFKNLFEFRKWQSTVTHNYYTFDNLLYSNFMSALVENLNPLKIERNEMIISELDEVFDVFFVCSGHYDIGYEMNKKLRFIIR